MARTPDERVGRARELFDQGMKLIDIAKQLDLPAGTVRRWKSTYRWDSERSEKKSDRSKEKNKENKAIVEDVRQVMENPDLTDKQRLFCLHYVKCFNATKAYQKAYGVDYPTANAHGYEMLLNVVIKDEISRLKQNKLNRVMLSEDDIFQKYMDIAFADITDYVSFQQEDVQVMAIYGPVFETDEETGEKKPVMKKVNAVRFKDSDGVDGTLIQEVSQGKDGAKIKLMDRQKALNWLADHMDLATAEQKAKIENLKANTARLQENEDSDDELEIRIIRKETEGALES